MFQKMYGMGGFKNARNGMFKNMHGIECLKICTELNVSKYTWIGMFKKCAKWEV